MIIFVVVFLSDFLKNILKCNSSPYSTLMTMYLPEAKSTMRALSGARCIDARLYTLRIKIGTRTMSARERSHS